MPFASDFSADEAAALNGTPVKPKGNVFLDMPKMLGAGTVDLVGQTAGLAARGVAAATGSPTATSIADAINQGTGDLSQQIRDSVSPAQKQANEQSLGEAYDNGNVMRKVAGVAAESLPTFLPAMAGAKGIAAVTGLTERMTGVASAATKARVAGEETKRLLMSEAGLTSEQATAAAATTAEAHVPEELTRLQKLGVFGTGEAAVTALTTPEQVRYQMNNTPLETLAKTPEFQKALAENHGDVAAARRQVTDEASALSALQAAGTMAGSVVAGTGVLGRVLNKSLAKAGVVHNAVHGLKEELAQEFFQSGFEQAIGNQVSQRFIDPATQALDGVLEQAILGGAAGGLSGAVVGGASGLGGRGHAPVIEAPADTTQPTTPPTEPPAPVGGSGFDAANTALAAQLKAANIPAAETTGSFEDFKRVYAKQLGVSPDTIPAGELNAAFEHHIQSAYETNTKAAQAAGIALEPHTGALPDFPTEQKPKTVAKEQSFTAPDGNSFRVEHVAPTPETRGNAIDLTDHVLTLGDAKSTVNPEAVNAIKRVLKQLGIVGEITSPIGTSTGPIRVGFKNVEEAHLAFAKLSAIGKTTGMQYSSGTPTGRGVEAERIAAATPVGDKGAMRVPILPERAGGHMADSIVVPAHRFEKMKRAAGLSTGDIAKNKAAFDALEAKRQAKLITPDKVKAALDKTAPEGVPARTSKGLEAAVTEILQAGDTPEAVDAFLKSHTDISTRTREALTIYKTNREKEIKNGKAAVPTASKETPRTESEKVSTPAGQKAGNANANDEGKQKGNVTPTPKSEDITSFAEMPRPAKPPRFKNQAEAKAWRKEQARIAKLSAEEAPKIKPIAGPTDRTPAAPAAKPAPAPKAVTKQQRAKAVREAKAALRAPQSDMQLLKDAKNIIDNAEQKENYVDALGALFELSEGVNVDPQARAAAKQLLEPKLVIGEEAIPRGADWDAARKQWEKIQKAEQKADGILVGLTQSEKEISKAANKATPFKYGKASPVTDVTKQYNPDGTLKKRYKNAVPQKAALADNTPAAPAPIAPRSQIRTLMEMIAGHKPTLKESLDQKADPRVQAARAALGSLIEKREAGERVSREELLAVPALMEAAGFDETRRNFMKGAGALALWGAINPKNAFSQNTSLAQVIKTGDLKASLQWIADNSTSSKYRMLARQLVKLLPKAVTLGTYTGDPARFAYTHTTRASQKAEIMLNDSPEANGVNESTLLHETVHAVIMARYDALNIYAANMEKLGPKNADQQIRDYIQLWRDFRDEAEDDFKKEGAPLWLVEPYRNPDEFITYALTHPEFQNYLKNMEYTEGTLGTRGEAKALVTLWSKLVDWVRGLLGMTQKGPYTWLDAAMNTSNDLLAQSEKDTSDFAVSKRLVAANEGNPDAMLAHANDPATPNEGLQSASDAITAASNRLGETVKNVISGKLNMSAAGHKLLLYWSSRKNIVKMFRDQLPALGSYSDLKDVSAAYANKLQLESQHLYSAYDKWMRAGGRKPSSVMDGGKHLTTNDLFLKTMANITTMRINPRVAVEQQPGYKAKGDNTKVEADYETVMQQWKALAPSGGQKILRDMLELNEARTNETYEALVRNLVSLYGDSSGLDTGPQVPLATVEGWLRDGRAGQDAALMFRRLNSNFKAMEGTYFHVGRFGDYVLRHIDKDGEHVTTRFETPAQLEEAVAEVKKNGWDKNVDADGKPGFMQGKLDQVLPQQYKQIYDIVKKLSAKIDKHSGLGEEQRLALRSAIRDMYVDMMPELSVERVMVQRKGTSGFRESEMARSWAKRMVIFNNQLSRVKYTMQIGDQIDLLRASVKELEAGTDVERALKAHAILDEIRQREGNEYDANGLPWVSAVNAVSHNFYLGLSPGYLLTNLLQPAQLTLPYLGSRHGFVAAAQELYRVLPTVMKITKAMAKSNAANPFLDLVIDGPDANYESYGLTQGQARMVRSAIDFGRIDGTFYHNINAVASGSSGTGHRISTAIGVGAHYSEIINRLSTALAAYNLEYARQKKENRASPQNAAEQYAIDAVDETQYDYSTSNKGRAMGTHGILGAATPLIMQFQSYAAQTLELLTRTARSSFVKVQRLEGESDAAYKARSDEIQSQNRKQLIGTLVTTGLLAGTMGLPFATVIFALINALGSTDDEPIDAKKSYQQWLADVFGNDTAETIAHGVPRLAGIDLARSGLQDLLPFSRFFADRRKWQDKIDDMAVNNMGPAFGVLGLAGRALDADNAGLPSAKVVEALAPNAIKGMIKAYEAADNNDFARDAKGNKIPVQLNSWDETQMMMGITPAKLVQQRESQYLQNTEQQLLGRRATALRTAGRNAIERGDNEALNDALANINKYNTANPNNRITMQSLWQGYFRAQRAFNVGLTGPGNLPASPRDIATGKVKGFDYTKRD